MGMTAGILRRATAAVAPAARLGMEYYLHSLLSAVTVARQLGQQAHARFFTGLCAHGGRDKQARPPPTVSVTVESGCQSRKSVTQRVGVHDAAAEVSSPHMLSACAAPATTDVEDVATGIMAPGEASGAGGDRARRSAADLSTSSPTPPQANDDTPAADAWPPSRPPPLPEGAYTKGLPEPRDEFVRIAGGEHDAAPLTMCYQRFGDPQNPPLVLIAGLGHSCLYWRDSFCQACADAGFLVFRVDGRDTGLSSHMDDCASAPLWRALLPSWLTLSATATPPPYLIADLAQDYLRWMEAVGLPRAHVVGSSMGGMVAQEVALQAPERVMSLTLFFTSTGGRPVKRPPLRARLRFLQRPKGNDEAALVDFKVKLDARSAGQLDFDEDASRAYWTRAMRRSPNDQAAFQRQLLACVKSPSRAARLRHVSRSVQHFPPTTVIHGTADSTIVHEEGELLASCIRGAKLILWPGMGHSIPQQLESEFVAQLTTQLQR